MSLRFTKIGLLKEMRENKKTFFKTKQNTSTWNLASNFSHMLCTTSRWVNLDFSILADLKTVTVHSSFPWIFFTENRKNRDCIETHQWQKFYVLRCLPLFRLSKLNEKCVKTRCELWSQVREIVFLFYFAFFQNGLWHISDCFRSKIMWNAAISEKASKIASFACFSVFIIESFSLVLMSNMLNERYWKKPSKKFNF